MSHPEDPSWISLATSPEVVRRALFYMVVVGGILVSINHGDALLHGAVDGPRASKIALTVLVPYCVSTMSTVSTMRSLRARATAK